jgi:hypothetical protein
MESRIWSAALGVLIAMPAFGPAAREVMAMQSSLTAVLMRSAVGLLGGLLISAGAAGAATYYVDYDSGADTNNGLSPGAAFRHCPGDPQASGAAASAELQAGDSVAFKGGAIYRGSFRVAQSGEEGRPIVYDGNTGGGFGEGMAVLDGSEPVTGWRRCHSAEECGGNPDFARIYVARVPAAGRELNALAAGMAQDGRMLYPAQYPDPEDPFYGDDRSSYLASQSVTGTSLTDPRLAEIGAAGLKGAYTYLDAASNVVVYERIESYDPATNTIHFGTPSREPVGKYAVANTLHPLVLDRPGEYVFADQPDADGTHAIYVWPWDDRDPNQCLMTCAVRGTAIEFARDRHHVTVQGLLIRNFQSAIAANRVRSLTVRGNEFTNIRQVNRAEVVGVSDSEDFVFDGNYVHHTPKMSAVITHTATNVVYSRNRIQKVGQSPLIFYRVTRGRITDNVVTDCYGVHSNAFSIYLGDRDILIARNEVRNSTRPLTVQNSENVFVMGNVFDGIDGAAVGLWGGAPHRRLYFLNNTIMADGPSIYMGAEGTRECVFKNNIISGFSGMPIREGNEFSHNIYFSKGRRLQEGEMIVDDPNLVLTDARRGDLRPVTAGPTVDMGTDVSAHYPRELFPDFDFNRDIAGVERGYGAAPDVGAYEVQYKPGALDGRPPIATGPESQRTWADVSFNRLAGREQIVLPAPGFTGEGGGKVEVRDPSLVPRDDFVTHWDDEGHWLEWTIEAPAGQYDIYLRYATQTPAPRRLMVNGAVVEGCESVTLDPTGGWAVWKEVKLPCRLTLNKGANVVRLTSLGGGGCNLDGIRLASQGRGDIVTTAGAFTAQGGGNVEIKPGVRHGFIYMWDAAGHWLEWTAEDAKPGRYEVVLRYATLAQSPRELRVNGAVVPGLESFELDRTDGWEDWTEVYLPVALELKAGRNVLRFTSLGGGGLNFDEIRLIPVE